MFYHQLFTVSLVSPELYVRPVWAAILLLPVVSCRNHLGTLFELAIVGKLHLVSTVTTIPILDLICNISQRYHEMSPTV